MPETNYDIFISFKDRDETDHSTRTWASRKAEQINISLKAKGYSPFYSRETMNDMVGKKVSSLIDHALDTAKVMILVFSCPEEVNSEWVKYEWSEFMRMNKPIINVFQGMRSEDWKEIQPELADTQGIDLTDDVGAHKYNKIFDAVEKYMPPKYFFFFKRSENKKEKKQKKSPIRQPAVNQSAPEPKPKIKSPPKPERNPNPKPAFSHPIQQTQPVSKPPPPVMKDNKPKPTKPGIKPPTVKRTPLIVVVAVVLVIAMVGSKIWSAIDSGGKLEIETGGRVSSEIEIPTLSELDSLSRGDHFTFGNYPQGSNGEVKPIEWRVLAVKDGMALVISNKLLDYVLYNEEDTDVTWETSSLREWMNDDFLNKAFSSSEQEKIANVSNQNPDNPEHGTKGGNATQDKIFALNIDEAIQYFTSDIDRKAYTTDYAHKKGLDLINRSNFWWLRSPGYDSDRAADVSNLGPVNQWGYFVESSDGAVRPAFWLNL